MKNIFYNLIPSIILYSLLITITLYLKTLSNIFLVLISIQIICLITITYIQLVILKNKNPIVWLFGFLAIPFLVNKKKKLPILLDIINILFIFFLILYVINFNNSFEDNFYKYKTNDDKVEVILPITFNDCDYNPLYNGICYDENNNITILLNNYNIKDFDNPVIDILNNYTEVIKSKDESFNEFDDPKYITIGQKKVYTQKYISSNELINYYFILSSITFTDSDLVILVGFVVSEPNYENNIELFNNVIDSITEIKET